MKYTIANEPATTPIGAGTLAEVVGRRAAIDGDRVAYTFLADGSADARSMSWSQLDRRARVLGAALIERRASGQPVMLALPSGLAFVESLFGCWYAGAIALPVSLPRHQRVKHRLHGIVADAGARFAIGSTETQQRLHADGIEHSTAMKLEWISADTTGDPRANAVEPRVQPNDAALLQYTSGSTGTPRGVVVTHANLMRNSALIAEACGHGPGRTIGGWLPLFHDMGLIGLVLQAAWSGAKCVFMSPERFLMRPRLWLQMISDHGVCSSPAPNFAYDLCVDKVDDAQTAGLDLSGWRNALNGSEPVRGATQDRFAKAFAGCGFQRKAFFPCYGLAEATLFVTGPDEHRQTVLRSAQGIEVADNDTGGHVGCGRVFGDTQLAIVDPQTARRVPAGATGEIWVAGESIARGYWNNSDATEATFNGRLKQPITDQDDGLEWLRTGDMGFIAGGELYITGRLRELIIIAGRNHYPVDVERTAESADPAIATSGAVAFSVDVDRSERLIIVAEVRREYAKQAASREQPALSRRSVVTWPSRPCVLPEASKSLGNESHSTFRVAGTGGTPVSRESIETFDPEATRRRVRAAVASEHEVAVHDVVLVCPGAVPRTTSGKISRRNTRDGYLGKTLERLLTDSAYVRGST